MHTLLPEDELGVETVTTCRNLWWTLYILDRHFSASLGLPMLLQDSDITTPATAPNIGSQGDSARSLQVNLSHLMTVILTSKSDLKIIESKCTASNARSEQRSTHPI